LEEITKKYANNIKKLKESFEKVEKELIKLAKENKAQLFDGTDVYESEHGRLIRITSEKVTIPRDALRKCEELGFNEVIRITKSLDRSAIEAWPDERLFLIGGRRDRIEKINYELKK